MTTNTSHSRPLILIADDDPTIRLLIKHVLKRENYQIVEVDNGEECLATYKEQQPDLVLLDAMMPAMDGFDCCLELKNLPKGEFVPILMITALDEQQSIDRAFTVGASDYVTKPIHPPLLRQRVRRLLQASKAEAALRKSEKKYHSLINNIKEVIFQADQKGRFAFLNLGWTKITGFTVEETLGRGLWEFVAAEDLKLYWQHFLPLVKATIPELPSEYLEIWGIKSAEWSALNPQQNCRYQMRLQKRNGGSCWVEIYAYLTSVDDYNLYSISGTISDVSEHKAREKHLQAENTTRKILTETESISEANLQILQGLGESLEWDWGEIWLPETHTDQLKCAAIWHSSHSPNQKQIDAFLELEAATWQEKYASPTGLVAKVWSSGEPVWITQLLPETEFKRADLAAQAGLQTAVACPLIGGEQNLGVMLFFSSKQEECSADLLKLMASLGSQIGQFIRRKQVETELQRQNALLQSELNNAADYVRSLLPSPLTEKVRIQHQFLPSLQLGGDAFDYYWLDEHQHHLVIYLLDVAGHGVQSALLSVSLLNILRSQSLYNTDYYQPWTVLEELNRVFQMNEDGQNYFTIWYGVYDVVNRELAYSCAGHSPAILIYPETTEIKTEQLGTGSIPIGMLLEAEFEDSVVKVPPQSTIYLFSDGIYEFLTPEGQTWGLEALIELLQTNQRQNRLQPQQLVKQIQQLNQNQAFRDDISLLQICL